MCTENSEKMDILETCRSIDDVMKSEVPLTKSRVLETAKFNDSINSTRKKNRRGRSNRRKLKSFSETTNKNTEKYFELPHAPYNSNQFLIEDHGESDDLDAKLSELFKTHDSSFSYDSENDNGLSEGEEKDHNLFEEEFTDIFNTMRYDELSNLSKSDLLDKYIQLEKKYETCMKIIHSKTDCTSREDESFDTNTVDEINSKDVVISSNEEYLKNQVRRLRIDNGKLRRKYARLFAIFKDLPFKNYKSNQIK